MILVGVLCIDNMHCSIYGINFKGGGKKVYFAPKKDFWLGAVYWVISTGLILLSVWYVLQDASGWIRVVFGTIPILVWCIWNWYGTNYTITTDNYLEVNHGPIHKKIPLNNIRTVKCRRGKWFTIFDYSLSRDCIEIKYRYGKMLVSPRGPLTFINELKQRCPEAEFSC